MSAPRFGLKLSEGLDYVVTGDGFDIGAVTFRSVEQMGAYAELVGQGMCMDRADSIDILNTAARALREGGNERLARVCEHQAKRLHAKIMGEPDPGPAR